MTERGAAEDPEMQVDVTALLPPVLAEIARVAGLRAAILIGAHKIGRIYIPTVDRLAEDHWLAQLVGMPEARAISAGIGHGPLDIPPAVQWHSRRRKQWEAIQQMTVDGASLTDIARALGVDRSTVRRVRRRLPPPRLPLFEA